MKPCGACSRKLATGLFDHPYTEGVEVKAAVAAHRPLVRQAAEESFVLLQNQKLTDGAPLLPLSPARRTVALIGPLADDKGDMVGAWAGAGNESDIVTLRQALAQRAQLLGTTLLYSKGTEIDGTSQAGFPEAVTWPVQPMLSFLPSENRSHERRGRFACIP